jgi:hypothetical protein
MAMLEDALEGNVVMLAAAGATTLVLPIVLPQLAPPLRGAIKFAITLFLESEAEAEGGLMGKLAESTVKALLDTLAVPGSGEQRRRAAHATIRRFEATARARSKRYAASEADAARRYRRHVAHLRRALAQAQQGETARRRELLNDAAGVLSEDW